MRFRAYERVVGEDAGRVLAALEASLRCEVADVERRSNRITVLGLGPGPTRRVNRRDMTVIYVIDENGTAVIDADVSFQASAFLGDVSQDEMMRDRLTEIFRQMRELLAATRYAAAESSEVVEEPVESHEVYGIKAAETFVAQEALQPVAAKEEESPVWGEPAPIVAVPDLVVVEEAPLPEAKGTGAEMPGPKASEVQGLEQELEAAAPKFTEAEVPSAKTVAATFVETAPVKEEAADSEPTSTFEDFDQEDEEESGGQRWWIVLAVLAACVAASLPFGAHYLSQSEQKSAAIPAPAQQQPAIPEKPEDLLRQWEKAIRTTDADAQAAYYAVPVEHYMWRANATRAQIVVDKKADISKRRGEWTVAIEQMQVDQQNDTAIVDLVKHYTQKETGRPQRQWYVPSELKLKYEYGIWWITSERDLGRAASSPDAF